MKNNPAVLTDLLIGILSNEHLLIVGINDKIKKLFDCQLLAYHMVKRDKTLDFKKLKKVFKILLKNGKYFKYPADFDQVFTRCKSRSLDKFSNGYTIIKLYNCIAKETVEIPDDDVEKQHGWLSIT